MLAHHMEDLKETTHKIHYERFRFDKLREMMGGPRDYRVSQQQKRQIFCFIEMSNVNISRLMALILMMNTRSQ